MKNGEKKITAQGVLESNQVRENECTTLFRINVPYFFVNNKEIGNINTKQSGTVYLLITYH